MSPDRETRTDRGFVLFIATAALILSMTAVIAVAFKLDSNSNVPAAEAMSAPPASTTAPEQVSLVIKSDEQHAKQGPEGTWHDAYLPAHFTVQPGATVQVTVHNYDEAAHTFTAEGLGTNVMIAAGSEAGPETTTFTFTAPTKKGSYEWHCMMPCDPWAMTHTGFMKGYVQVA